MLIQEHVSHGEIRLCVSETMENNTVARNVRNSGQLDVIQETLSCT